MEIYKIMRNRCEVNVIFTGKQYIFHEFFYGILAVATRKGMTGEERDTFILECGNENAACGSFPVKYCEEMAKRFINKVDCQYVKSNIKYEVINVDVDKKYYIDIMAKER